MYFHLNRNKKFNTICKLFSCVFWYPQLSAVRVKIHANKNIRGNSFRMTDTQSSIWK